MHVVHPLIRLYSLLVFIALVAPGGAGGLWAGLLLLLLAFAVRPRNTLPGLARVVMRLRWLLLSIAALYGWWTPGDAVIDGWGDYSPTWAGLEQGALRAGVLVAIVAAVHWVMATTRRPDLLAGVLALLAPLRVLGLDTEQLAVRMVLTLENVPRVQDEVKAVLQQPRAGRGRMMAAAGTAQQLLQRVLVRADSEPAGVCEVTLLPRPAPVQWLIPVGIATWLWLGHWLGQL